jgi:hypothetical protein
VGGERWAVGMDWAKQLSRLSEQILGSVGRLVGQARQGSLWKPLAPKLVSPQLEIRKPAHLA